MKDEDGCVLIDGFYDDLTPLTATELAQTFGIARPERPQERLEAKLNQPTLNVLAMESGGRVFHGPTHGDSGIPRIRSAWWSSTCAGRDTTSC